MSRRCNAIVHPLTKGSQECKNKADDLFYQRIRKKHLDRLKAINERDNKIPGPNEAKQITRMMEQEHLRTRERRLEAQLIETRTAERLNREMLQRVARAHEIGKTSSHWDDRFMRKWDQRRQEITEERLKEERRALRVICDIMEKVAAPESQYRRELMEKNWKDNLKKMVKDIRFPCSDWWNEYLHCVAGKRPRKPPPYPPECSCSFLEKYEDCWKGVFDDLWERETKLPDLKPQ